MSESIEDLKIIISRLESEKSLAEAKLATIRSDFNKTATTLGYKNYEALADAAPTLKSLPVEGVEGFAANMRKLAKQSEATGELGGLAKMVFNQAADMADKYAEGLTKK